MKRKQKTLRSSVRFEGIGLHTGETSTIEVHPASENTGLVFVTRYKGKDRVLPYTIDYITDTRNNITVSDGVVSYKTVEHMMAALYGLGISNAILEFTGPEMPIMDGSAGPFVEAFMKAGVIEQDAYRPTLRLMESLWVTKEDKFLVGLPFYGLKINYTISFPNSPIGTQTFQLNMVEEEAFSSIFQARTFGFVEDLDYYQKNGLVLGGGFENVHVYSRRENRSVNGARYDDEPVRHKILDLLGALALLPYDLEGFLVSYKGGHALDVDFVRVLSEYAVKTTELQPVFSEGYSYQVSTLLNLEPTAVHLAS
ncbi:UDP-3-O-acyl-N-acetylglucosamine deacetylase [Thermospira aquatica]|uniref:UDP-3-O-acyl-N-acetylglucosamine deacetylase n=1 Tax=Thermospira aquatica TaxID=2828656 RepID=A0AAX3BD72_9SPIR|nr:UDP-3-O-acyl-N-acetylglucosamine deacetylase [Thermospira aquatica]URA10235.1 UDP-3-O-[3-hydroxymyristoyl] N-acetylglucosamine deacetylase [Thermospira aquatica]